MDTIKKKKYERLFTIAFINIIIFLLTNFIFNIKYEEVDDFVIYNLYSGLDGTYNIHGIFIHPVLCMILMALFKIISAINWHTIFLLILQFICFTIIGYLLLEKHQNKVIIVVYTMFASVCYTTLLCLIQFTSVAALLIATSFFIIINILEENIKGKKYICLFIVLFSIGIMIRINSLLIILPFLVVYGICYFFKFQRKKVEKKKLIEMLKIYLILLLITVIVYISNLVFYQNNKLYKEYLEYNELRTILHDLSYNTYESCKTIYDEIGWSENDYFLFQTFNMGDENVYSKENLQKIVDYKKSINQYYNLNLNIVNIGIGLIEELIYINEYITLIFIIIVISTMIQNKEKRGINIGLFATTIGINVLFIVLNRSVLRVVIPAYILGTALCINNFKQVMENQKQNNLKNSITVLLMVLILVVVTGESYDANYKIENFKDCKDIISYTNEHKENVYLYTIPSLQYRYLAYSVYEMPPQGAFSNLRSMGGWDMYTGNYYDFKERYNLEGTFLDVLKENVYLINGEVKWFGRNNKDYIDKIVLFIKEHYDINVTYEKVEEFGKLYIYKLTTQ